MRGKNHTSIPSPFMHHSIKEHPLSQSDSIIFHHILSTLFPRTPRRKKKEKSLDTSTKFRNSIPPLPSTFPAKERNLHTGEILNSEPNLTFSFSGRGKKKGGEMERREEKSRGSKRSVTRRKQHQHQIWSQATRAGCFSPQGKIVLPRFMRADKKEDGGKQRESRDIWPVFLVREEFSSSVPSKVQRRNTKGNCRELLQRRFLLGRRKVVSLHEEEESWAEECDA